VNGIERNGIGMTSARTRERLIERLKAEGSDPVGNSPAEYSAFLRNEIAKWAKVIKSAGVKSLQ